MFYIIWRDMNVQTCMGMISFTIFSILDLILFGTFRYFGFFIIYTLSIHYLYIYIFIPISIRDLYTSIYIYTYIPIPISISISISIPIYLHTYIPISIYTCIFIPISISTSVYLFIYIDIETDCWNLPVACPGSRDGGCRPPGAPENDGRIMDTTVVMAKNNII